MVRLGYSLYLDTGSGFTQVDLTDGLWDLGSLSWRLGNDMTFTIIYKGQWDDVLAADVETRARVNYLGTPIIEGKVISHRPGIQAGQNVQIFEIAGLLAEADNVFWIDSLGSARIAYNVKDPLDPDFDASREDKTVGDIIEDMHDDIGSQLKWDNYGDTPGGSGDDDLSDLDVIPGKFVVTAQSARAVIESLIAQYMPQYKPMFLWGGSGWNLLLLNTRSLDTVNLEHGGTYLPSVKRLQFRGQGVWTAAEIQGDWIREERLDEFDPDGTGGEMTELWNSTLEQSWTEQLAQDNPDTYGPVYRDYGLGSSPVLAANLGNEVGPVGWVEIDGVWWLSAIESYDPASGTVRFSKAKVYNDGGILTKRAVRVRYAYRGSRVIGQYPVGGTSFSGDAFDKFGTETKRYIFDEDYKNLTIAGTITKDGSNKVIDRFLAAAGGALVGATVSVGGGTAQTITANTTQEITAPVGSVTAGQSYVVTITNNSTAVAGLAEALHAELSGINLVADVECLRVDYSALILTKKFNLTGYQQFDDLEGVGLGVTVQPWARKTSINMASLTSIGASVEYSELKRKLWLSQQTQENEIQLGRNKVGSGLSTGGVQDGGAGIHAHQDETDGGYLLPDDTKYDDGTNQAAFDMEYVSQIDAYQARWRNSDGS